MPDVYRSISNGIRPSQWRLEIDKFENLILFFPPTNEQNNIARYLNRTLLKLDELKVRSKESITLLQERRTALISAAVSGKIDVRENG